MTPTRKEIVKLLREAARIPLDDYAAGAEQIKRFRRAADALEAAEPKGTRLASARGKLGDLFVEAGEAGLDKSGTEDFVREGFGEWVERTLAETLTAAPVLTFEERVERALAVWDEGLRSSEPDDISPGFRLRRMRAALRAAGVEE